MNIIADASLPGLTQAFPSPFKLSLYQHPDELEDKLEGQDLLLCRSTLRVTEDLLKHKPIKYVATASSGIDHIDEAYLKSKQIQLISAKGANATSVADYVLSCLASAQQAFFFKGKKAAVIGVGEVGSRVIHRLQAAGYEVICYDPPKAMKDSSFESCRLEAVTECDLICVHAALHNHLPYPSKYLLGADFFSRLRPGALMINASRGGIVNEKELLSLKPNLLYCTDVYENEPHINPELIDFAASCTPHIAGHSLNAKYEAVAMISRFLHDKAGLELPNYDYPELKPIHWHGDKKHWQHIALSIYDPSIETKALKRASKSQDLGNSLEQTFKTLRKHHTNRHDFNTYRLDEFDLRIQQILGCS